MLSTAFPQLHFLADHSIAPYTYMKVGGRASLFVVAQERAVLKDLIVFCTKEKIPYLLFGGASNCIFSDDGFDGLVIQNKSKSISFENNIVHVDSGMQTAVLVRTCVDHGLSGLEHFVGVPGSVGGALYNNAHFTSDECIGDKVLSVEYVDDAGTVQVKPAKDLDFSYDYSIFHTMQAAILSVDFVLKPGDRTVMEKEIQKTAKKRAATQPIGVPSTGCMFQNPLLEAKDFAQLQQKILVPDGAVTKVGDAYRIAAGFLIDQAGLKEKRIGGAMVSEKHATFLVNTGGACAKDVDDLASFVQNTVMERFSIQLVREVFFLPSA